MTVRPKQPTWSDLPYQGLGRPRTPKLQPAERCTVAAHSLALPLAARGQPGPEVWVLYRQHLDDNEPRYYLSNSPQETPLATLAYVGGSWWHIENEFETGKSDVGMDEYETRNRPSWHHHVTMRLPTSAFLLRLQQAWGKTCAPHDAPTGVSESA